MSEKQQVGDGSSPDLDGLSVAVPINAGAGVGSHLRVWIRSQWKNRGAVPLLDALLVLLCYQLAVLLRFDGEVPPSVVPALIVALPLITLLSVSFYWAFGVYARAWQYGGLIDVIALAQAIAVTTGITLVVDITVGLFAAKRPVPLSVVVVGGVLTLLFTSVGKMGPRIYWAWRAGSRAGRERLLIVGAGRAGQWLVREILSSDSSPYLPVCLVDDDPRKLRSRIHGVEVAGGSRTTIPDLVQDRAIDVVAIAMPSAPAQVIREIVAICQRTGAQVRIVPGVKEILGGLPPTRVLRDVTIGDLLGRDPVEIDLAECRAYLEGSVVLISGAAGSIGSELARQVVRLNPAHLLLLDSNESGLFDLTLRLKESVGKETALTPCVCNVERGEAVERIFKTHRPRVVFHAAAYKHVPLMEQHPDEAVLVNLMGTLNICRAASQSGTQRFVLISTDKAVRPSSVMGATKRICEEVVRSFGQSSRHNGYAGADQASKAGQVAYCAVRFGNVLDSRGSVIPTFNWQIDQGGPVTVTHPDMRRFFMTIPEAASLVVQAGAYASGGDIFLLDMGEEMNITDLAQKLIQMRGLRPGVDIDIAFTGLRAGEKLREELVIPHEVLVPTQHPKISRVASYPAADTEELISQLLHLRSLAQVGGLDVLRSQLFSLVLKLDEQSQPYSEADSTVRSLLQA